MKLLDPVRLHEVRLDLGRRRAGGLGDLGQARLGLVAAVVLANGSVVKAIAMVFLGLLFGLVGTDVNSGIARYSMGFPQLADGIGFVVIAMGMFGLACMGLGFCSLAATVVMKWTTGLWMTGNPFLLLSALFVLIGTQSIGLGLLGEVLSRTYFESQDKRSYAVSEALNIDQGASRRAA